MIFLLSERPLGSAVRGSFALFKGDEHPVQVLVIIKPEMKRNSHMESPPAADGHHSAHRQPWIKLIIVCSCSQMKENESQITRHVPGF